MRTRDLTIALTLCLLVSCSSTKPLGGKGWHTSEVKKASLTVTVDGNPTNLRCSLQAVRDSVSIWSLRPVLGIEVGQIRADKTGLTVIDRVHRQYARARYKDLPTLPRMVLKYRRIEKYTSGEKLKKGSQSLTRRFKAQGKKAAFSIDYPDIRRDMPMKLHEEKVKNYKETDIDTLLKNLGL